MTARDPAGPLQTALYGRLTGDATLMALITGVFDEVPEGQAKPYVVLGESYATPRNSHDRFGRRITETLHIWSDHLGYFQLKTISNRVVELLDHQPLTVSGHDVVLSNWEFGQTIPDPDPDIRHGVLRVAFVTEQTP